MLFFWECSKAFILDYIFHRLKLRLVHVSCTYCLRNGAEGLKDWLYFKGKKLQATVVET